LPARKFRSFKQAADEAAISCFYGGIHYRHAIENGQKQGEKIRVDALKITTSTPEINKLAHSLSRLAGDDTVWTDNDGSFILLCRINL